MKREEQRVLSGGLCLVTPSDKTPQNDALALLNFRVDQAGVLRGADTFSVLANFGAPVHTVFRITNYSVTQPSFAYSITTDFGPNGAFLIGAGTSFYLFLPDTLVTTPIYTGFSGNPLSIVVWNGFIWVMDSLAQIKLNPLVLAGMMGGNLYESWLPAAPTTALTATPYTIGASGSLSGTYSYFVTFAYEYVTGPSGGQTTTVFKESLPGPSSASVTPTYGAISVQSVPTFSGTFGEVRLYRTGGTLTTAHLIASNITSVPYSDFQADSAIAGNATPPTVAANGAPPTPTAAPVVASGASPAANTSSYTYYVTYVSDAGLETNPGPSSTPSGPSPDGVIALTNIPVSPDPSVVKRRIYRTGGTLGQAYQVVEIKDNVTTSYDDAFTDLQLTELGIVMPTTNDPPPTGVATDNVGVVGIYFNTLLIWKNNRLYWSQDGIPLFPGSQDGSVTGNWVNVGDPNEKIQAITLHSRLAAIHKERTIWRLIGDPLTGTLEQTAATCGALSKTAVANCGSYDLVLSRDGVYQFNMDALACVSDKISPVFIGRQWVQFGASDIAQDQFFPSGNAVCGYINGTAFLGNSLGVQYFYHHDTQRFADFQSQLGAPITAILAWGSQYTWYAGDANGNLLASQQLSAAGQALVWQTPFLDQGTGDVPKSYQELVLDLELNGATALVYVLFDNSGNAGPLSSIVFPFTTSFTGFARQKFYMPLSPDVADLGGTSGGDLYPHISVRIQITDPVNGHAPPAVHGLYIYYSLEERDASIRGTDVLDFHSERISLCKKIEVDAIGQVTIYLWTDLPGGLASRFTYAGTPSTTRRIFEFNVPPNLRGRLWRVDVVPQETTARVYSVRGWMRQIGLAAEADWAWQDFALGAEAETPDAE